MVELREITTDYPFAVYADNVMVRLVSFTMLEYMKLKNITPYGNS